MTSSRLVWAHPGHDHAAEFGPLGRRRALRSGQGARVLPCRPGPRALSHRARRRLNAEPDSDEIRLLCGHKTAPAREGFVLVDRLAVRPGGRRGVDVGSRDPERRRHHGAQGTDRLRPRRPAARRSAGPRPLDRADRGDPLRGVWPSDHAGLPAELETGCS